MMRARHVRRRRPWWVLLAVALAATALSVGGLASAFWSAYGQGDESAGTQTPVAVTLSPGTPAEQLYPGSSSDVVLTVANPNSASVHIGSLALDATRGTGGFAADPGHPGCSPVSLTFVTATNTGAGWTVPGAIAGSDGVLPATLTGALSMGLGAAEPCQGARFTVFLTAGP
jgi:hypothetical protein